MKIAVRYYTKSGNTKKLADAIAEVAEVEAKTVSSPLDEDVDILFLGSSIYAAGMDKEVKHFIAGIDKKVGKVVNFSTAAMLKGTYNIAKKEVEAKGLVMADEEFHCRGQFHFANKNRPDAGDLKEIKAFVMKVIGD